MEVIQKSSFLYEEETSPQKDDILSKRFFLIEELEGKHQRGPLKINSFCEEIPFEDHKQNSLV